MPHDWQAYPSRISTSRLRLIHDRPLTRSVEPALASSTLMRFVLSTANLGLSVLSPTHHHLYDAMQAPGENSLSVLVYSHWLHTAFNNAALLVSHQHISQHHAIKENVAIAAPVACCV